MNAADVVLRGQLLEHFHRGRRRAAVPVRFSTGSCSFSNRISASCFGEPMLNSPPASAKICRLRSLSSRSSSDRLRRERLDVDADAGAFELGQDRHQRQFEIAIDRLQFVAIERRLDARRQLQRNVAALAGINQHAVDRHLRERQRLDALAADVFFG